MGEKKPVQTVSAEEIARTFLSDASGVVARKGASGKTNMVSATEESETEWRIDADRYATLRELGRGGMGCVEEVFDAMLGRSVARKAMLEDANERAATMLIAEAQTCAQLEHPAIVPVYDLDADEHGRPRYTMRVVEGRTLRDVLSDNQTEGAPHTPLAQLLGILRQVCLAIDYAHSKGVVHRDLKPENVIVGNFGEVYVLDWGIAHVAADSLIVRADIGTIHAGSPGYMAPEQVQAAPITARTDVFALGVMLYEILTGDRPFEDADVASLIARSTRDFRNAPSSIDPDRVPAAFDTLVVTCLARHPGDRPASARFISDAIDAYLDQERERAQREADAEAATREGVEATELYAKLDAEARTLREKAEAALAEIPPWESVETKQPAWDEETRGRQMAAEARRALARASGAFVRALGRVENHPGARAGLAALYFKQFLAAEDAGDAESMAQYLDLARAYDDGPLALQLANRGELIVECSHSDAELSLARYETRGWLLELGEARPIAQRDVLSLEVGSYVVTIRLRGKQGRWPVLIKRAMRHTLRAELDNLLSLPDGMVLVPGGPFLAPEGARSSRLREHTLPDFAVAEIPVTFADYVKFLDDLPPDEARRRCPCERQDEGVYVVKDGEWRLTSYAIEGEGGKRIVSDPLQLPVFGVSWFDAMAYAAWRSKTGAVIRIPTSLEWDKAARGVDGRAFPMGGRIDPAFAKLRESRPEASQPEPVASFALDVSPYEVRDLTGGVGDWTSSPADGAPLPEFADEDDAAIHERQAVWRGCSWASTIADRSLRFSYRVIDRTGWVGFRLATDLGGSSSRLTVSPMQ